MRSSGAPCLALVPLWFSCDCLLWLTWLDLKKLKGLGRGHSASPKSKPSVKPPKRSKAMVYKMHQHANICEQNNKSQQKKQSKPSHQNSTKSTRATKSRPSTTKPTPHKPSPRTQLGAADQLHPFPGALLRSPGWQRAQPPGRLQHVGAL